MTTDPPSSSPPPALRIEALVKRYADRTAVDGLSLEVPQGEFHALLGPNGAGKTTTLRIVAGLLAADAGRVAVLGHDVAAAPADAKRLMAFLPDEPQLYGKLRPLEYLEFVAGLWAVPPPVAAARAESLLRELSLWAHRDDVAETFSRGMRQKLALSGALIHDPALLILDEPLTGLDAAAVRQVKDLLIERTRQGRTVLLTTHLLDVAERLADRISIVQHGRVVAQGGLDELRARAAALGMPDATLEAVFLHLVAAPTDRVDGATRG